MNSPESGGRFRVWVDVGAGAGWVLAWDRKVSFEWGVGFGLNLSSWLFLFAAMVAFRSRLATRGSSPHCGHSRAPLLTPQTEGGFPELKVLKQRIRNHVQPEMDLGHSDKKSH
jgi:predicted Rdx family selenoprotein